MITRRAAVFLELSGFKKANFLVIKVTNTVVLSDVRTD